MTNSRSLTAGAPRPASIGGSGSSPRATCPTTIAASAAVQVANRPWIDVCTLCNPFSVSIVRHGSRRNRPRSAALARSYLRGVRRGGGRALGSLGPALSFSPRGLWHTYFFTRHRGTRSRETLSGEILDGAFRGADAHRAAQSVELPLASGGDAVDGVLLQLRRPAGHLSGVPAPQGGVRLQ